MAIDAGLDPKYYTYAKTDVEQILREFNTSKDGLCEADVRERIKKYGYNDPVKRDKKPVILEFLLKFTNPLIIILIAIGVFTLIYAEKFSAIFIFAMILISVFISFLQEHRSNKEVERLIEMVRVKIKVIRNKKIMDVNTHELVPGDIIEVSAGDIIPADVRLIYSKDLFMNESTLTGEAFPVEKHYETLKKANSIYELQNMAFMGTSVVSGSATCVVLTTGKYTEFSHIARNIAKDNFETSFDKGIREFTWMMIKFVIGLVIFILVINTILKGNILESAMFALAVAVGLTPEMLPMLVTINLTKGARDMAKKEVIVKHLESIQNLGAMDILCTDKTGTLTEDRIVLEKYCNVSGKEDYDVLRYAYINSFYQTGLKNVLDDAILKHEPIKFKSIRKVDEIPYDFVRKMMSIVVDIHSDKHKGLLLISKGAPEEIIRRCSKYELNGKVHRLNEKTKEKMDKQYVKWSSEGFRVIAVAYKPEIKSSNYTKKEENNLILKGYLGFFDPPKQSAFHAIRSLEELGIEVKILTGDNELVTKSVCGELGLKIKGCITGKEMDTLNDVELKTIVEKNTIFARVSPMQKERIVDALQKNGHTVGFLGDGINDAPTLKKADVGISVNTAVDIAKESSGIILLKKNLMVLKEGIIDGRKVFGNIVKYIEMGASSNFGNMFSVAGASIFLPFLPMLPIQIILNNFLYDISQLSIPTDNIDKEYVQKPRPWNIESIKRFVIFIGPLSSIFDFMTFIVFFMIFNAIPAQFQTAWFIESLTTQVLIVYIIRTNKIPIIESKPSMSVVLTTLFIVLFGLTITMLPVGRFFGFEPLPVKFLFTIYGIVAIYIVMTFFAKKKLMKKFHFENLSE
ncbi:MAG: magnesium-translocating P-type ATPase [Candidatus Woesearchaeota archaeon]